HPQRLLHGVVHIRDQAVTLCVAPHVGSRHPQQRFERLLIAAVRGGEQGAVLFGGEGHVSFERAAACGRPSRRPGRSRAGPTRSSPRPRQPPARTMAPAAAPRTGPHPPARTSPARPVRHSEHSSRTTCYSPLADPDGAPTRRTCTQEATTRRFG